MHPADNMPNYGREVVLWVGDAACMLCCNYTLGQKHQVALGMIQLGIDYNRIFLETPEVFVTIAGQNIGRKFPILFAGLMLNDPNLLNHPAPDSAEDTATYYGTDVSPNETLWTGWASANKPYADVGSNNVLYLYVYGTDTGGHPWRHEGCDPNVWHVSPFPNNGNQYPFDKHEGYRRLVSYSWIGHSMAAHSRPALGLGPPSILRLRGPLDERERRAEPHGHGRRGRSAQLEYHRPRR